MLTTTQRRCKTVRRDWGHCVGDWNTSLLQLFVQVHDDSTLLLLGCMVLLLLLMMVVVVVVVSSRMQESWRQGGWVESPRLF